MESFLIFFYMNFSEVFSCTYEWITFHIKGTIWKLMANEQKLTYANLSYKYCQLRAAPTTGTEVTFFH